MEDSDPRDYHAFSKSEFKPGIIIRAPLHEEDFNRTPRPSPYPSSPAPTTPTSSHISHTTFGAVYSENRFFIVVETHSTHYTAIPRFTYSGDGLKGHQDAREYASIEDHRYPGTSCREARHLLVTGELKHAVRPMKAKSVAHLTYPVSRKYCLRVSYQGCLREGDVEFLGRLFRCRGDL